MLVPLDPESPEPLHRQLYRFLKDGILAGRFAPGSRLPSTRSLAKGLAVSRNTVLAAVGQLTAEGLLEGRVGSGTRVTDHLGKRRCPSRQHAPRQETLLGDRKPAPPTLPRPFTLGVPALDLFPTKQWARIAGRRWRGVSPQALSYGNRLGELHLRQAITEHVQRTRGITADPEHVLIVHGAQQATDLVIRAIISPDDDVWLEDPGYPEAAAAIQANGGNLVPVPVDSEGMIVGQGLALAPNARVAYVTPSHQYPTGVTMTLERRVDLLAWASDADAWIIEDDYDSEYRFRDRPLLALRGLDDRDRVIYLGTFSKTIAPSLRLGYLILPAALAGQVHRLHAATDHSPNTVDQLILADFIHEGHFARHVHRMRQEYSRRRDALIASLRSELPTLEGDLPSDTGLHLTLPLPTTLPDTEVVKRAARAGLAVAPLSQYYRGEHHENGVVLGFGCVPVEAMPMAVGVLANAVRKVGASKGVTC